jgi:hypothetical protein
MSANPMLAPLPMPEGISVDRDIYATNEWGDPCIRVCVVHRDGNERRMVAFEVPFYKTTGYVRESLFRWRQIEVTDYERISAELNERGWRVVGDLVSPEGEAS